MFTSGVQASMLAYFATPINYHHDRLSSMYLFTQCRSTLAYSVTPITYKCNRLITFTVGMFTSGVNLINFFGANLITLFCKLDHCINTFIIFLSYEKILPSKRESKFTPKQVYEITPWCVGFHASLLCFIFYDRNKFIIIRACLHPVQTSILVYFVMPVIYDRKMLIMITT